MLLLLSCFLILLHTLSDGKKILFLVSSSIDWQPNRFPGIKIARIN